MKTGANIYDKNIDVAIKSSEVKDLFKKVKKTELLLKWKYGECKIKSHDGKIKSVKKYIEENKINSKLNEKGFIQIFMVMINIIE